MTNIRVVIRVDLSISRPWAVGAAGVERRKDGSRAIDLPVLVDRTHEGVHPFLPATSLVGALRQHLGATDGEYWLGPRDVDPTTAMTAASRLRCLGVGLSDLSEVLTRTTTAIDGLRRAAQPGTLRTEEVVTASPEAPTRLSWWLQLDQADRRLPDLVAALARWRPFIGRRRSTGQGDAEVSAVGWAELDLAQGDPLTWWLQDRAEWDGFDPAGAPPGWRVQPVENRSGAGGGAPEPFRVDLVVEEPLFIGNDHSVVSAGGRGQTHVTLRQVPGSSWKGIFRHRITHVLRVCGAGEDQISSMVARLFGSGRSTGSSEGAGHRGVLRFRLSALPAYGRTVTRTHVAIDRITGGAMDRSGDPEGDGARGGALFSVQAIEPGVPVRLEIDGVDDLSAFELNLLRHVVRDVSEGLVGVGGMTSRGYGTLAFAGEPPPQPAPVRMGNLP